MGKINNFLHKESLKKSFMAYMLVCILTALLISLLFSGLCQLGQSRIYRQHMIEYENTGYKINFNGEISGIELDYHAEGIHSLFSPFEEAAYNFLGILSVALPPVCFVLCIGITSILFYRGQLQKPLEILDIAADNITDNNLDFNIAYNRQNELGKLCTSFEKMRAALQDNNIEMWHQIEERKRLNAAFAHDLRTPLTVLKGQSEMLVKYASKMPVEKVISTAEMMQRHIMRLEAYVSAMNNLQRLEDIAIDRKAVPVGEAVEQMRSAGISVCREKRLVFNTSLSDISEVCLDLGIVMRVYENLLSNAFRFAETTIRVCIEAKDNCLRITVSDDGCGFSGKDLTNATKPFYKAANETDYEHFGMGLNICKILCEKHGGYLELKNDGGAAVLAVFRQ